jgi:hypothetical protein
VRLATLGRSSSLSCLHWRSEAGSVQLPLRLQRFDGSLWCLIQDAVFRTIDEGNRHRLSNANRTDRGHHAGGTLACSP